MVGCSTSSLFKALSPIIDNHIFSFLSSVIEPFCDSILKLFPRGTLIANEIVFS